MDEVTEASWEASIALWTAMGVHPDSIECGCLSCMAARKRADS